MSCEISRLVKQLVVKGFVFLGNLYVVVVFLDVFNAILFEGRNKFWVQHNVFKLFAYTFVSRLNVYDRTQLFLV